MTAVGERSCPACAAAMPSAPGYTDWCEHCGWNLEAPPQPLTVREGRFAQFADALGRRSGERLARELRDAPELSPRWSAARALATAIAVAVLVFDAVLLVGGVALIVADFPNLLSLLIGVTLISVGVVIRPRLGRHDGGAALGPERAPELHALVTRIAGAAGVRPPEEIVVDAGWNASWSVSGPRRRRLVLGLPLLASLDPQQRVALIAHEVGHERAERLTHSVVLWSALGALDRLSELLRPPESRFDFGLAERLAQALAAIVALPVDAVLWVQARLLLRDMQRAEYLADVEAAKLAGAPAVIALHERLLLHQTFELVVQHAAIGAEAEHLIDRVRQTLRTVPARERERRHRIARLQRTRLADTHPPTGLRIALLEDRGPMPAVIALDTAASARIDAELRPLEAAVGRALVDRYRSALYSG